MSVEDVTRFGSVILLVSVAALVALLGNRVSRLLRVRYGPVELPRDLKPGEWRELPRESLEKLFVK